MTCIEDPLHLYQVLLLYDVMVAILVNMDVYAYWNYAYLLLNGGLVAVALTAVSFPAVSFLRNEYMGGFAGASIVVLLALSHVASGWAALFSIGALLVFVGALMEYSQSYLSTALGFTDALTSAEKLALAGGVIAAVVVLMALLYYFLEMGRTIVRSFIYAVVAWVAVRAMWLSGLMPSKYCCESKYSSECALWLQQEDWIVIFALFSWRLCAYAAFRWFRRDKVKLGLMQEIHTKQIKALTLKNDKD
jgi:hypothetical protein